MFLFNDALNTFYLRLFAKYGKGPLRYRERKPTATSTWLLLGMVIKARQNKCW